MRVGLIVAANKWTGAGAVAELYCRALRVADVDARLLFVGGRNLERRLEGHSWALPGLVKDRTPAQLRVNLEAINELTRVSDIIVCTLPHDHLLCVAANVHRQVPLVRAFRNPKHIRRDPYHRFLNRRILGALLAYPALKDELDSSLEAIPSASLPVPIEDRFRPVADGVWRDRLGIPHDAPVIGSVGKLAGGRGFELLLEAAARLQTPAHVIVVGHGERRPALQALASSLEIADRVHWTGYREKSLPNLYGAMNVCVFSAPGSDWGHRAISEAQACGCPVVAAKIPGVNDLIEDEVTGRVVRVTPDALSDAIDQLLVDARSARRFGEAGARAVENRRMPPIGRELAQFLAEAATLGR